MNFQVVTCADKPPSAPYYLWREFNESLKSYSIEPLVLGWGRPWMGLGSKPKLLKSAIESGQITAPVIIFCDAFDVVFSEHPERIIESCNDGIVWNAEKNCFPDASLAERHPKTESPFRYFNSGLSAGPTEMYLAALKEMKADEIPEDYRDPSGAWHHQNDQHNWMLQFIEGSIPMRLDSECAIFQAMFNVVAEEIDVSGPRIRNLSTGTTPAAFHFNGGAKTEGLREPIIHKLLL